MQTQSQTINQMLIQEYKQQQVRLKQVKDKLLHDSQQMDQKIYQQLQYLNQTSSLIVKSAINMTKVFVESLDQDSPSTNVIDISILSSYLKRQKLHLSELILTQSKDKNQSQKSGKQLLHCLSKRKKVEKYYQHLQCLQLQKEIEYLEKNILLPKSKNRQQTISYDDIQGVTLKQQQQIKEKMKMLLGELQRVVGLSGECGGQSDDGLERKARILNQQNKSLKAIEELVDKERKQIVMVKDFFNTHNPTETIELLQQKIQELKNNPKGLTQKKEFISQVIKSDDITFLLGFECKNFEKIKVYKKPYDEVNDLLNVCKSKLKKVKI